MCHFFCGPIEIFLLVSHVLMILKFEGFVFIGHPCIEVDTMFGWFFNLLHYFWIFLMWSERKLVLNQVGIERHCVYLEFVMSPLLFKF